MPTRLRGLKWHVFTADFDFTDQRAPRYGGVTGGTRAAVPCLRRVPRFVTAGAGMEIRSINAQIAQAVSALKSPAQAAKPNAAGAPSFIGSLDAALKAVSVQQNQAAELQRQFALENPDVSLEETMIAMNKSQISFSAAVQVRNRLVQAYEQVMNMPI